MPKVQKMAPSEEDALQMQIPEVPTTFLMSM